MTAEWWSLLRDDTWKKSGHKLSVSHSTIPSGLKTQKLRDGVRQSNLNRPCRALNTGFPEVESWESASFAGMSSVVERCFVLLLACFVFFRAFASVVALTDNCAVGPISGCLVWKRPPKQQARTKHWPLPLHPNSKTAELRSFALLVDAIWVHALPNQVLDCLHVSLVRGEHSRWKAGEHGHYCHTIP